MGGFHLALKTGNFGWNVKRNKAFRNKPPRKCGIPPEVILFFEKFRNDRNFRFTFALFGFPFSATVWKFRMEFQKEQYISKERGIFRFKWKFPLHLTRRNSENSNWFLALNRIRRISHPIWGNSCSPTQRPHIKSAARTNTWMRSVITACELMNSFKTWMFQFGSETAWCFDMNRH